MQPSQPPSASASPQQPKAHQTPSSNPTPSPSNSPATSLLSKVDPLYPIEAKAAHTEGTVVLDAVISKKGDVIGLKVVSGDQIFRTSAEEAVIQWKFKPYLVDGAPTNLETYITMRYRCSGSEGPRVQIALQDAAVVPPRPNSKVSPPRVIYQVEPKFTEAERRATHSGSVLVNCWVDEQGNPINVHILRGVGTTLDQKALAAVKQYRFKPAMENGEPVLVELNIEVNIDIF